MDSEVASGSVEYEYEGGVYEAELLGGEQYHSAMFQDGDGNYILALSFSRSYEYADGSANDQMNYISGVHDAGFREFRPHDVGIAVPASWTVDNLVSAEVIRLDGTRPRPIRFTTDADASRVTVNGVVLGEKPVLIRLIMSDAVPPDC